VEYEGLVSGELAAHALFKSRLEAAFKTIVNLGRVHGEKATLLSTACHDLLKKGGDEELRKALEFLKLVVFVADKVSGKGGGGEGKSALTMPCPRPMPLGTGLPRHVWTS
jgi:hypothetical protein